MTYCISQPALLHHSMEVHLSLPPSMRPSRLLAHSLPCRPWGPSPFIPTPRAITISVVTAGHVTCTCSSGWLPHAGAIWPHTPGTRMHFSTWLLPSRPPPRSRFPNFLRHHPITFGLPRKCLSLLASRLKCKYVFCEPGLPSVRLLIRRTHLPERNTFR